MPPINAVRRPHDEVMADASAILEGLPSPRSLSSSTTRALVTSVPCTAERAGAPGRLSSIVRAIRRPPESCPGLEQ